MSKYSRSAFALNRSIVALFAVWCSFVHTNPMFRFVSSFNLDSWRKKFGMKSALDCIMQRTSSFESGGVMWFNASTFAGSGRIRAEPTRIPQNSILEAPKVHLLGLSVISALEIACLHVVRVATIRSTWIRCAWGMCAKRGWRAMLRPPWCWFCCRMFLEYVLILSFTAKRFC